MKRVFYTKQTAVIAAILLGLIGLRHLNTVPRREWRQQSRTNAWTETIPGQWGEFTSASDFKTGKIKINYNPAKWVPEKQVYHPAADHEKLLYTAEGFFDSSYRVKEDGIDKGVSYKNFATAFLQTFGSNGNNLKILRAIDR